MMDHHPSDKSVVSQKKGSKPSSVVVSDDFLEVKSSGIRPDGSDLPVTSDSCFDLDEVGGEILSIPPVHVSSSCRVILRNNGFSPLQCSGWKTVRGVNVIPPSPLINTKSQGEFLWRSSDLDQGVKAALKYQYGGGGEDTVSLLLYFHILPQDKNGVLLKLFHGSGVHLGHMHKLEENLQLRPQMEKVHFRGYHCMATLSEDKDATLIVDLWNDYG